MWWPDGRGDGPSQRVERAGLHSGDQGSRRTLLWGLPFSLFRLITNPFGLYLLVWAASFLRHSPHIWKALPWLFPPLTGGGA